MKPTKLDFDAAEAAEDEWIYKQTPRPVKPETVIKQVQKAIRHDDAHHPNPPKSPEDLGSK